MITMKLCWPLAFKIQSQSTTLWDCSTVHRKASQPSVELLWEVKRQKPHSLMWGAASRDRSDGGKMRSFIIYKLGGDLPWLWNHLPMKWFTRHGRLFKMFLAAHIILKRLQGFSREERKCQRFWSRNISFSTNRWLVSCSINRVSRSIWKAFFYKK